MNAEKNAVASYKLIIVLQFVTGQSNNDFIVEGRGDHLSPFIDFQANRSFRK